MRGPWLLSFTSKLLLTTRVLSFLCKTAKVLPFPCEIAKVLSFPCEIQSVPDYCHSSVLPKNLQPILNKGERVPDRKVIENRASSKTGVMHPSTSSLPRPGLLIGNHPR
jgi:hypothetical protein